MKKLIDELKAIQGEGLDYDTYKITWSALEKICAENEAFIQELERRLLVGTLAYDTTVNLLRVYKFADQVTVPDGWALVPVEPTKEMMKAGNCGGQCGNGGQMAVEFIVDDDLAAEIYQKMIAAAPKQETSRE
jgi:hypothetical protein